MMTPAAGRALPLRHVLVLLGIVVTTAGLVYFATEFSRRLEDWTRVASLVLLSVVYVSLGVHFDRTGLGGGVVERPGWRWLRATTALYIIGVVAAFTAVVVFLGIDRLDPVVKVFAVLLLGTGLILAAARRARGAGE